MLDSIDVPDFLFRLLIFALAWWIGGQRRPPEPPDEDGDDGDDAATFLLRAAG